MSAWTEFWPKRFVVAHVLRWVILAVLGITAIVYLVRGQWLGFSQSIGVLIIIVFLLYLLVPIMVRWLADLRAFFCRIPESTVGFVLKDEKAHRVVIAASGSLLKRLEGLILMKKRDDKGGVRYEIVDPGYPLFWIGVPWIYRMAEWYERSQDEVNPAIDPIRYLALKERTYNIPPSEVDTAERIQIRAKLIASFYVWDPLQAVFGVNYFIEAVESELDARWRRVAGVLRYFLYGEGKTTPSPDEVMKKIDELEPDTEIYVRAHRELMIDTWLFGRWVRYKLKVDDDSPEAVLDGEPDSRYWDITDDRVRLGTKKIDGETFEVYGDYEDRFFYVREQDDGDYKLQQGRGDQVRPVTTGEDRIVRVDPARRMLFDFNKSKGSWSLHTYFKFGIPEDKAARRIFDDWGIVVRDVEVRDIDPTDEKIRTSLRKRFEARAEAMAVREKALGQKQKDVIEGEGVRQRKILEGEGEGKARRLTLQGDAQGYALQMRGLGISKGEQATITLIADTMKRIAKDTEMTVMAGSQGGWADLFASVPFVQKLWRGDKPLSDDELLKAISVLSPEQRRRLLEEFLQPETVEGAQAETPESEVENEGRDTE